MFYKGAVRVHEDRDGRFRWVAHLRDGDKVVAQSPIYGYATEEHARTRARRALGIRWRVRPGTVKPGER